MCFGLIYLYQMFREKELWLFVAFNHFYPVLKYRYTNYFYLHSLGRRAAIKALLLSLFKMYTKYFYECLM